MISIQGCEVGCQKVTGIIDQWFYMYIYHTCRWRLITDAVTFILRKLAFCPLSDYCWMSVGLYSTVCVSLSPNIHDNCTSSSPCLSVWTSYSPFLFSLSHSFIFVSTCMFVHRRWCNLSHQWCSCLLFICWSCAQFYGTCQTGKISTRGNSPLIHGLQGQMSWRLMVHKTYMFTLFGGPTCTIGLTSQSRPNVSVLYNWQWDMQ